jgi:hypothetical protein
LLFAATHVTLLAFSYLGMMINPNLAMESGWREFLKQYPALDGLCRWDCLYYRQIALEGYKYPVYTNFFPLLPLLSRGLAEITRIDVHFALLIIPATARLASFVVIYRIFRELEGEDAAQWGLTLFATYPFAYIQSSGYAESLMIFCSAVAVLLALRGNHIWAGLAVGLAVLTKQLGIFAGAALLAAQIRQRGLHPKRFLLSPAILGLAVPWLCLSLYMLYQYMRFNDPFLFWTVRSTPPWWPLSEWGIVDLLTATEGNEHTRIMFSYLPFLLIPTAGAIALLSKKQWIELALFAIAYLGFIWMAGIWASGRHSASCWPAFLPLGLWLSQRPKLQGPAVAGLALFQGLYFYLYSHGFLIL